MNGRWLTEFARINIPANIVLIYVNVAFLNKVIYLAYPLGFEMHGP